MSNEKKEMLAEIHQLIDEQMEVLQSKLTPGEAVVYVKRKQRIEELLMRISSEGF